MYIGKIKGGKGGPGGGPGGDAIFKNNNIYLGASADLFKLLDPVVDAAYNTGPRAKSKCFPGTRVDIIKKISQWADHPSDRRIAWLHGPAGFGKSAVARTVAYQWDQSNRLLGSFCFFRNSGNQSKAARLLPTLAYQLTVSMPETEPAIEKALRDKSLLSQPVENQFQKLIEDPITALPKPPSHPGMIIVIDGVDECDDLDLISGFLQEITSPRLSQFPVLFFFSSRMEGIQPILQSPTTSAVIHQFSLLDFDAGKDIKSFLKAQFTSIHDSHPHVMSSIPRPWPSSSDLDDIVELVKGSFVFATALVGYVRGGNPPPERLAPIVKNVTGVDGMCEEILTPLWKENRFQTVFSTIILLKRPLSIVGLKSLLQLDSRDVMSDVFRIQSIVLVPDDDSEKVEIVHTSVRDFSTSLERSGEFYVDTAEKHLGLAIYCLQIMSTPAPKGEVFETEAASYASEYWLEHLHQFLQRPGSLIECDSLTEKLTSFTLHAFDTWFTCMILEENDESFPNLLYTIIKKAKKFSGFPRKVIRVLEAMQTLLKADLKSLGKYIDEDFVRRGRVQFQNVTPEVILDQFPPGRKGINQIRGLGDADLILLIAEWRGQRERFYINSDGKIVPKRL